ncbi:hypothetical protein [Halorhabdus sp. CUG00001]|uniref:hypothetical protein n=1 Tax=Halorhabdus sp. CUG00001 TaxID=2600297 RepID=UPI00131B6089|nr:hypothetical protein [Halorhabdus sp. CUG00001]
MPTRRTLLSQVAAITLGSSLLGVEATAASPPAEDDTSPSPRQDVTTVSVSGDPTVFGHLGFPAAASGSLGAIGPYATILSSSDVSWVSGTVQTRDGALDAGSGTAVGAFDPNTIATDLKRHTAFSRLDRSSRSTAGVSPDVSRVGDSSAPSQPDRRYSTTDARSETLVQSAPASVARIAPTRIDVAVDTSRPDVSARLARRRRRLATADDCASRTVDPISVHQRDLLAHVDLGTSMRGRLLDIVPASARQLNRFVRSIREASVAIDAGPETTALQYGALLSEGDRASEAFRGLLAALSADERTQLLDRTVTARTVSAHVSMPTDAVWNRHGGLLDE